METALQEKLKSVVELVDMSMVDPDIDIDYCIPGVAMTSNSCDITGDPYILVKYTEDNYMERKIKLHMPYTDKDAEGIANYATFSIEQFKEEVDSLRYGAQ